MFAPRVTVVIPTYNWSTVLPWSIGSVLAQTWTEWELWVVGDGCTDDSADVVGRIDDPRVRWHNLPVNGRSQVGPNNWAIDRARGEYIAYLGHDDLWLPNHLAPLVDALDAAVPFVFGRQLRIDPGRRPYVSPPEGYRYHPGDWLAPTSTMHRRADAVAAGGWRFPDATSMHDPESDLWQRLAGRCGDPVVLDAVTSLKLPAALRHDVYRHRPDDEQAQWWGRIMAAAGPAEFLAASLADGPLPPARYETVAAPASLQDGSLTAAERHRVSRAHKGLDDR